MEKTIIKIDGLSVYAVKNPHGIVVLPCASCKYEKEESSGKHCKNCCNGTENNFINKGYKNGTLQRKLRGGVKEIKKQ